VGQRCAIECLPVCLGGEGIEVLVRASVQSCIRGPDDPAKFRERFFIDLVILEELRVVAKISQKPVEFPESSFRAVQPTGEEPGFKRFGFQNCKADLYEGLLRMPSVASPIHANEK
jgi:hypothetical protein